MADNTEYLLGQIDGKLDSLIESVKAHVEQDERRFSDVYTKLGQHSASINQAKGAKAGILLIAGGVSGFVAIAAAAAPYILGK